MPRREATPPPLPRIPPAIKSPLRLLLLCALALAQSLRGAEVSFSKEVAPILHQKCVTCHGGEKTKGGYRLDTFANLLKPGDSGKKPIEPRAPEKSHLFELLTTSDADDRMPQKADPLAKEQIATIRKWIRGGAKFDGGDENKTLALLIPAPPRAKAPEKYPSAPPVLALAWSAGGQRIATSGYHEVLLWETNGVLAKRISGMPQRIHGIIFSGKHLAVAGGTPGLAGEVLLVDLESSEPARVLLRIADEVVSLASNPTGDLLAAGGADNAIHIFELPSGREIRTLQQHADWVTALAFSPDGKRIASASRDRTARLFDVENGNLLETYAEHDQALFAVAISTDGKTVISAGRERRVHLWSANDAKKAGDLPAGSGNVTELLIVGDKTFVASAEKSVAVFKDKKQERKLEGHKDWVYSLAAHAPTGRIASGSHDGEVRLRKIESGELLSQFVAAP